MALRTFGVRAYTMVILGFYPILSFGQQLKSVPEAFESLSSEPEVILIRNEIDVPIEGGHLQGVQRIEKNGIEKLLISGSSHTTAYVLQVDLTTRKTDTLIALMNEPYRHAGGIQVSEPYLAVGIEDNIAKTVSKVCLYDYLGGNLYRAQPMYCIDRTGEAKRETAGASGLIALADYYLMIVANWDSRNWDFYTVDPERNEQKKLTRITVPDDWPSYQAINLISDEEAIYAIGFYKKDGLNTADLIRVSTLRIFDPILENIGTKTFISKNSVDFGAAAGLQIDNKGKLHIWGTQREALKEIVISKFSQH